MGTNLNNATVIQLLKEDLEWLLKQPHSLERGHIECLINQTIREYQARIDSVTRKEFKGLVYGTTQEYSFTGTEKEWEKLKWKHKCDYERRMQGPGKGFRLSIPMEECD